MSGDGFTLANLAAAPELPGLRSRVYHALAGKVIRWPTELGERERQAFLGATELFTGITRGAAEPSSGPVIDVREGPEFLPRSTDIGVWLTPSQSDMLVLPKIAEDLVGEILRLAKPSDPLRARLRRFVDTPASLVLWLGELLGEELTNDRFERASIAVGRALLRDVELDTVEFLLSHLGGERPLHGSLEEDLHVRRLLQHGLIRSTSRSGGSLDLRLPLRALGLSGGRAAKELLATRRTVHTATVTMTASAGATVDMVVARGSLAAYGAAPHGLEPFRASPALADRAHGWATWTVKALSAGAKVGTRCTLTGRYAPIVAAVVTEELAPQFEHVVWLDHPDQVLDILAPWLGVIPSRASAGDGEFLRNVLAERLRERSCLLVVQCDLAPDWDLSFVPRALGARFRVIFLNPRAHGTRQDSTISPAVSALLGVTADTTQASPTDRLGKVESPWLVSDAGDTPRPTKEPCWLEDLGYATPTALGARVPHVELARAFRDGHLWLMAHASRIQVAPSRRRREFSRHASSTPEQLSELDPVWSKRDRELLPLSIWREHPARALLEPDACQRSPRVREALTARPELAVWTQPISAPQLAAWSTIAAADLARAPGLLFATERATHERGELDEKLWAVAETAGATNDRAGATLLRAELCLRERYDDPAQALVLARGVENLPEATRAQRWRAERIAFEAQAFLGETPSRPAFTLALADTIAELTQHPDPEAPMPVEWVRREWLRARLAEAGMTLEPRPLDAPGLGSEAALRWLAIAVVRRDARAVEVLASWPRSGGLNRLAIFLAPRSIPASRLNEMEARVLEEIEAGQMLGRSDREAVRVAFARRRAVIATHGAVAPAAGVTRRSRTGIA